MAEIINLNREKTYTSEAEMVNRIMEVIYDYRGEISFCSVIGALEMCKADVLKSCMK